MLQGGVHSTHLWIQPFATSFPSTKHNNGLHHSNFLYFPFSSSTCSPLPFLSNYFSSRRTKFKGHPSSLKLSAFSLSFWICCTSVRKETKRGKSRLLRLSLRPKFGRWEGEDRFYAFNFQKCKEEISFFWATMTKFQPMASWWRLKIHWLGSNRNVTGTS